MWYRHALTFGLCGPRVFSPGCSLRGDELRLRVTVCRAAAPLKMGNQEFAIKSTPCEQPPTDLAILRHQEWSRVAALARGPRRGECAVSRLTHRPIDLGILHGFVKPTVA